MKDIIVCILATAFAIFFFIAVIYTQFANPDMTETRLFLTYWPLYTVCLVGAAVFGLLLTKKKKP